MSLERYFKWYETSQKRWIRFASMKLVGQAGYYWSNIERLMAIGRQEPIRTWEEMRAKLNQKYIPITFQDQQLNKWSRLHQENRSATEYIETFDEFLTRCSEFVDESPSVTLSRGFRFGLCENLRRELLAWGVCDLEHAYQIVWDLDVSRESYFQGNLDFKSQFTKSKPAQSQYKNNPSPSIQKEDDKVKGHVESVPRTNPHTYVMNDRAMVMWRRFVSANPKPSFGWAARTGKGRYTEGSCVHRQRGEWLWQYN